ncbi:hypothetical protein JMUB6875_15580 [Nocardia sp. JMUB6875]
MVTPDVRAFRWEMHGGGNVRHEVSSVTRIPPRSGVRDRIPRDCYEPMPHNGSRTTTFESGPVRLSDITPRRMANDNLDRPINTCTSPCLAAPDLPVGPSIEPTLDVT